MSYRRLLALVACLFATARSAHAEPAPMPTLERTIELARARALSVVDAEGEVGVAAAQMAGARQSSFGNPYADIQIDHGLAQGQQLQALAYGYIPVDVAGQRGARITEADKLVTWRRMGLVDAKAAATGDAAAAYGALVVGAQRITESVTGEQLAREEARFVTGRLEAKDATIYERALADAEVARWVQQRAEAELATTNARLRLAMVTGAPTTRAEALPPGSSVVPPSLRAAWDEPFLARVVDRSPLLARAAAERAYWEASAERYEKEKIPPLSFEVIGGRGAAGEARVGGGLVVTLPITRRYQGEIARAEHGRAHVQKNLPLWRNMVESRVRAARDAFVTATRAVAELDKTGIPALETAVNAANEGYRAGKIELTRVLLARRDLATARSRRLDLLDAGWRAYADLAIFSGDLP